MRPNSAADICRQAIDRFWYYFRDCGFTRSEATDRATADVTDLAVLTEEELDAVWSCVEQQQYEDV